MKKPIIILVILLVNLSTACSASSTVYRMLASVCGTQEVDSQVKAHFNQAYQDTKQAYQDQNMQPVVCKNMHSLIANGPAKLLTGDLAFSLIPGYTHINQEAFKDLTPDDTIYTAYHETALHKLNAPKEIGKQVLNILGMMAISIVGYYGAYAHDESYGAAILASLCALNGISYIYRLPGQCRAYEEKADKCVAQVLTTTGKSDILKRLINQAHKDNRKQSTWHPSDAAVAKNLTPLANQE